MATEIQKTDAQWREELTPEQYAVLRQAGTERAFTGRYWDVHDDGIYRCAGCGAELFSSETQFESGSGWPSFTEPAVAEAVEVKRDLSHGMIRSEVVCKRCGGHLGHVFDDGPREAGGLRYCINSAALALGPYGGLMAVVRAEGLVKTFGEGRAARRVLDGASLSVAAGEVVAVVGRSGTGKSTLLHLIGGLDRPEAGSIVVDGVQVTGAGERALSRLRRRRVGFVFQFFHLLPELSGEANVLLAGRVRDASPDAAARGRDLIDALGLRAVAGSLPSQLSGGEQQRFAIARALVNDPAVLLADEPTGNLDVEAGAEVLRLLRAGADEGRALVMVTHEESAASIADRVLRLEGGRLVEA
jgi:methionine-R-sulfoxide reductase